MFRRNYLTKQLERLTVTLHRILFNKEHLPQGEVQPLLEEASRHLLGMNLKSLQALSSKDILELLTYNGSTDTAKALVISDIFASQGELYRENGEPDEAYRSHVKALDLLLALQAPEHVEDADVAKETALRIGQGLERLRSWVLPASMQLELFAYWEEQGEYAKAEDTLFHYMEDHPELVTAAVAQGTLFYERLLDKTAEELHAGNFTREEAGEGLELLKKKLSLL
ncbi:DUF6483 family protein [Paenibacillus aestuarii]|uniref:DUF6483 family protein n=1 Tax=Paenibacillus aestuarii TaxID=516965 RepID=A0ABW0K254_9BACL|nr:DUF6483 family protein [Paenibacillus aestuarii]